MMKHKLFFLLFAGFTLSAAADTLTFTGVGGSQSDGVYTYPYYFTTVLNGVTTPSVPLMCVDFNREITFGESWNVNEAYIPRDHSAFSVQLRQLAIIDYELLSPADTNSNDYQFAAWSIFDAAGVNGKNGMTPAAQKIAANAIKAEKGVIGLPAGFSYSKFVLFSPLTADGQPWTAGGAPQRFIGEASQDFLNNNVAPSATPEPSGLMLLGTGILGVAGVMYRRVRSIAGAV